MFPFITSQTRALLRRALAKKSGPTRRQNCITVRFPIVIEKQVIFSGVSITIGKYTVIQFWRLLGPLFWRGRAAEVLSFAFYLNDFFLVSSIGTGMKYIQEINKENTAKRAQKTFT